MTSTTTTAPPTTTTTLTDEQLYTAMEAEIERACTAAVGAGSNPSVEFDPVWGQISTEAKLQAAAQRCYDIRTTPTTTVPPETVSQSNARETAADYLDSQAFSRSGLIEQLKYEGFSTDDATYGVDAIGADWNEQAAKSAADYLNGQSFSHTGLVEQLVYEGFTREQAEYGVGTTGL